MSLQHSGQKSRRLGSPPSSRVFGPMRATKSFGFVSPSVDPQSLSACNPLTVGALDDVGKRRSSSTTVWTEKMACLGFMKEKKSIRSPEDTKVIHRSVSLDTIASSYLCGEWPRSSYPLIHLNLVHCPIILTADKWTQTTDDLEDSELDGLMMMHPSQKHLEGPPYMSCGESREVRTRSCHSTKVSPLVCGYCASPVSVNDLADMTGLSSMAPRSKAIIIPVVSQRNPLAPCQGSAEGFNQEVEKLVRNTDTLDTDQDLSQSQAIMPDGHRAPIADLLNMRSVDTQTPSGGHLHSSIEKHFLRIPEDSSYDSPSLPIIPGADDSSLIFNRPGSTESEKSDQCERLNFGTVTPDSFIPVAKTFLKRESPEGCERIEVEFTKTNVKEEIYHELSSPVLTSSSFLKCLIPSERSAFCPLLKKYVSQQALLAFSLSTNPASENDNSIEAK